MVIIDLEKCGSLQKHFISCCIMICLYSCSLLAFRFNIWSSRKAGLIHAKWSFEWREEYLSFRNMGNIQKFTCTTSNFQYLVAICILLHTYTSTSVPELKFSSGWLPIYPHMVRFFSNLRMVCGLGLVAPSCQTQYCLAASYKLIPIFICSTCNINQIQR